MSERYREGANGRMYRTSRVDLGPSGLDQHPRPNQERGLEDQISHSIRGRLRSARKSARKAVVSGMTGVALADPSARWAMEYEGPMWARLLPAALTLIPAVRSAVHLNRAYDAQGDVAELADIRQRIQDS
jgi:hypothetical protein